MKKIMLHEPDESIFEIISLILIDQGYSVEAFPYWKEKPIDQIRSFNPDLIMLDCFQNTVYPAKVAKLIRSQLPSIGLIVTSCNADINKTFVKMGFDSYLPKPFDIDQLIGLIRLYSRKVNSYQQSF